MRKKPKGYAQIFAENRKQLDGSSFTGETDLDGMPKKAKPPYVNGPAKGAEPYIRNVGFRMLSKEEKLENKKNSLYFHITKDARKH